MDQETLDDLIAVARQAMARAHVPVSSFPVGAAVLTANGKIYPGCNTESIIAGLGVCAERSAIDHAVVHGERHFKAILIVSTQAAPLLPCGACRQYLYEFSQNCHEDLMVYAVSREGEQVCYSLSELLPNSFGPRHKG
ncbi:MAG: cytidine deaminase [Deltaproteobacteria bacterium]|nr:cytidine deaminase [Deltaproteobacteria bacterium]